MPTPSLHINPSRSDWSSAIDGLSPIPGICIFIDIVGSTAMKQRGIRQWIALIHNCFSNAGMFLDPFLPLKGIGDSLMYYIEAQDLADSGYAPINVFDELWLIATEKAPHFPIVKIGAAWCEQVYSITFLKHSQDYYGIDIDLTSRLQSLAAERQVIIEKRLYDKVHADYQFFGNRDQFVSFKSLSGPSYESLKGIPNPVEVFRT